MALCPFVLSIRRERLHKGSIRSTSNARSRGEKKNKELKNFYRFQMREERKETLQSLREQFEKDKESGQDEGRQEAEPFLVILMRAENKSVNCCVAK